MVTMLPTQESGKEYEAAFLDSLSTATGDSAGPWMTEKKDENKQLKISSRNPVTPI